MNLFDRLDGRVFCLFGELGDLVCENDLRIVSFNEFLSAYLKSAGFDVVVFYLSGGAMRTFDDSTARSLIGANNRHGETNHPQESSAQEGERENLTGERETEAYEEEEEELYFDYEIPSPSQPASPEPSSCPPKLKYAEYVSGPDFFPIMQQLLGDTTRKNAIIFENIRDFLNVNQECCDQFKTLLHYLRSDATDQQKSIVIFQSMSRDEQQILQDMQENDILLSNFFYLDSNGAHPLERRFFHFHLPKTDEISNLLEHYRLFGDGAGHRLSYAVSQLRDLAYLLEQCSQRGSSGTLLEIVKRLQDLMGLSGEKRLSFGREQMKRMYPQVTLPQLPLEQIAQLPQGEGILTRMRAIEQQRQRRCAAAPRPGRCELQRFPCMETKAVLSASRFLIRGTQHTHRTETARAIADYLYLIGEVGESTPHMISGQSLLDVLNRGQDGTLRSWIRAAANGVLILDDLEELLKEDDEAGTEHTCKAFHRIFLEELDRNNTLHFILVIHSALEERLFSQSVYDRYQIPEKNRFTLTVPDELAAAASPRSMGRLSPEGR